MRGRKDRKIRRANYNVLIKFTQLLLPKEICKRIPWQLSKRMTLWDKKYKKMGLPDKPVKPDGYDAYMMTNDNVTVAQQRMDDVGLVPYNRIKSLVALLHSTIENSSSFQAPEIPIDTDLDDDVVTYAGFAIRHRHAYGKYIDGSLFPKWKNKRFVMEEV